ncbi:MAG TPA: hypothetical protein VLV76_02380, partial [Candidatus Acidoferrum sp.]|nr:hypothetical protein [Candidatus Acidoferrum sp.]
MSADIVAALARRSATLPPMPVSNARVVPDSAKRAPRVNNLRRSIAMLVSGNNILSDMTACLLQTVVAMHA